MDTKQPEALRLANMLEKPGYGWHSTPAECAAELQRLQSENDTLLAGYDAARLEIESLQAQAQQCGAGAGCCAQAARIEALQAQLEAVGAGGVSALMAAPNGWQLVPAEPTKEMVIEAYKAQGEATSSTCEEIYRAMLAAAPQPPAQAQAQEDAKGAERYRFLRDGEWRDTELEPFIRLQRNALWDSKIDAAIAAQQGDKT